MLVAVDALDVDPATIEVKYTYNGEEKVATYYGLVDIYKDGQLWESQVLNGENNWSYVWYVSEDDNGIWTVAERDVNEFYTVSIQQNGGSFTIINNHAGDPDNPDLPQTGDTFSPLLWVMIMCFSGIMLLVIGVYGRRRA